MGNPPPTLATIAAAAGVSRMTVSRALRNAPAVDPKNRRRILEIAAGLGYTPDPQLAALMHYLRHRRNQPSHEVLAYVSAHRGRTPRPPSTTERRFRAGVERRARELGYGCELFLLSTDGMPPARLAQVLRARGIRGAVICNAWAVDRGLELLLKHIVGCFGGTAHADLPAHRATSNHFSTIRLLLHELDLRGYRRIGLYLDTETDANQQHCWRAVLSDHLHQRGIDLAPLLHVVATWDETDFVRWVRHSQTDVVLTLHRPAQVWLQRAGLAPQVGFALLDRHLEDEGVAGIDQHAEAVGVAAVDLIAARLLNHDTGIPEHPHMITIRGTWVEGSSVRPRTGS